MNLLITIAFAFFAWRRLLSYLHIFQQEEYDGRRFLRWITAHHAIDRKISLIIAVVAAIQWLYGHPSFARWAFLLIIVALTWVAVAETDPRKSAKKKLVLTGRAIRILVAAGFLSFTIVLFIVLVPGASVAWWLLPVQMLPLTLILGNLFLGPYESRIQNRYWQEAHSKLLQLRPTTIAVTGSYGKTSVKHILGHILSALGPTLITPGSVNTPMGIARVVREQLFPHHRFFICEMGAYGPGSIERLCRLAPPDCGIITAIGMAHYERFKSIDTVATTKFELAVAVRERNGWCVIPETLLTLPGPAEYRERNSETFLVVGTTELADCHIHSSRQCAEGLEIGLQWHSASYLARVPLYGEHHVANVALAFAAACRLGMPPDDVIATLTTVPQIAHRYEVKRQANNSVIIDDAYNSNPEGFVNALQSLSLFREHEGRAILVTPGMVELGAAHDSMHENAGKVAAECVDVLIPILPKRIRTLVDTYRENNANGAVIPFQNFSEAQQWLNENVRSGDVVLLENDLPDLYEGRLSMWM